MNYKDFTLITADSRKVTPGALFVAVRGYASDGHNYIADAIAKGATGIICEEIPEGVQVFSSTKTKTDVPEGAQVFSYTKKKTDVPERAQVFSSTKKKADVPENTCALSGESAKNVQF